MAWRPGITPAATVCERLVTAVTVRLNVAATEKTGVVICSADGERVVGARLAVVARFDHEPIVVRVRAVELALARRALGKVVDDGSMNGVTRAVVLQRQVSAHARATTGPGDEPERRLCSGPAQSLDPTAAGDPVLARGPAGGAVDLGVGVPEGDVGDRLPGDRVMRQHVQRVDNELAGRRSDRRHLLIDDRAAVR